MSKPAGNPANLGKAHFLPDVHRRAVRADDKIKLHRRKAGLPGLIKGVLAQGLRHPPAPRRRTDHKPGVSHMAAATQPIGLPIIGTQNRFPVQSGKNMARRAKPIRPRGGKAHIPWQGIRFPGPDDRLHQRPEC